MLPVAATIPKRREQRIEPVLENGVVVSRRLQGLDERLVGPVVGPQRWILLVVFGPTNGRELHHRRRNDMHLHSSQDECGIGSGYTQLGQLRCQRLLNRQEQQRRPVAVVCDGEKVLSLDQCRALVSEPVTSSARPRCHPQRADVPSR